VSQHFYYYHVDTIITRNLYFQLLSEDLIAASNDKVVIMGIIAFNWTRLADFCVITLVAASFDVFF
jgi:hypothetical protein